MIELKSFFATVTLLKTLIFLVISRPQAQVNSRLSLIPIGYKSTPSSNIPDISPITL